MRPTFRLKLLAIVGIAAFALVTLMVTGTIISQKVQKQLDTIEGRFLPKLALKPQLESQFESLRRALQDAVAAQDTDALDATRALKSRLIEQLIQGRNTLDPVKVEALIRAIDAYYSQAYDVSRRLIAGEAGESVVQAMESMQIKHVETTGLLESATTLDKRELADAFTAARNAENTATRYRLSISFAALLLVLGLSFWLSRDVLRSLSVLAAGFKRYGRGDFTQPIPVISRDELGQAAEQANRMGENLQRLQSEQERMDWLKTGLTGLAQELRGELEPEEVGNRVVRYVATYLEAPAAALYYADGKGLLRLLGQHALSQVGSDLHATPYFRIGEGLVGQAAMQDKVTIVSDPPADYLRIRSGLGEGVPNAIVLLPLTHVGKVMGVLELAFFQPRATRTTEFLNAIMETLAIAIEVAHARSAMHQLLTETQNQAQRLSAQEEELRTTNEELQAQQEELKQANEELTHQTRELESQRKILEQKNAELTEARHRLEEKADELATVSAYKSQFLANMSHELRTPLNSMLLLSNLLAENEGKNLTEKQVEYCKTVHGAGKDLLALINQVLDLARIESGRQEVNLDDVPLQQFADYAKRVFDPLARDKGLQFVVEAETGIPETIRTDRQRVEQILTNLLGNAVKFTRQGEIKLRIQNVKREADFHREDLKGKRIVAFVVSDTGIGITPNDQQRIFEPFEQVEATTDRRYGGSGLGLSIAREIAFLLGGELKLESIQGKGSTFTFYLPTNPPKTITDASPKASKKDDPKAMAPTAPAIEDRVQLLIIEDDPIFAELLGEMMRSQGLKFFVAPDGETGLQLAETLKPTGIILDVRLPDIDGFAVMDRLRSNPATTNIPVHIISALDEKARGMALGAVGYVTKPATRVELLGAIQGLAPKRAIRETYPVLVVEDDPAAADSLMQQLAEENLKAKLATNARDALEALQKERFSCMVLDLSLPDMDGLQMLTSLQEKVGSEVPPVIVYTGRALRKGEAQRLEAYAEAVVLKEGSSSERLLSEIRLFVRQLKTGLPQRRTATAGVHPSSLRLQGKKILVVDDDMRTVYALSALLRAKGMEVLVADTGRTALGVLSKHPDIDAVLMDIMMPEMDGYEAMQNIRIDPHFSKVPIIALTAKAMKGDREKCMKVGANDYLTKPVDGERLITLLHTFLSKSPSDRDKRRV